MKRDCAYILDKLTPVCSGKSNAIEEITIINDNDILDFTSASVIDDYNIISQLRLMNGKKGFKFADPRRVKFTGSNKAGDSGTVGGQNTKTLQFLVLGNDPETTRAIDALSNGSFVVAIKTNDKSAATKGAIELFGLYSACDGSTTPYTKNFGADDENLGGYIVTLTCTESYSGVFLWDTDLATTLADYEALGWSSKDWYGVKSNPALWPSALIRTGNMDYHRTLPIHSQIRGCLLRDNGTVNYYLDANDRTKKADGTPSNLTGSDGMVMQEIPSHYARIIVNELGIDARISSQPIPGYTFVPKMYISSFEASIDRTNAAQPKLASVVNTSVPFRGGNNTAAWDGTYRTLLGMPATSTSLTNFRAYARNRGNAGMNGAGWNAYTYNAHQALYWLYVIEYANTDSQLPFNATPTANGYKQGGLGEGVTNMSDWNGFNGTNPFIPCGTTNSLGNKTGVVSYTTKNEDGTTRGTLSVPSYRGIENPFGHIWKWTDGVKCRIQSNEAGGLSEVYTCDNPANFQDVNYDNYVNMGDIPRTEGYIKKIIGGEHGVIMSAEVGGSSNTYLCDYFQTNIPATSEAQRGVLLCGNAHYGASAGLSYATTDYAASFAIAAIGSRLCFLP